MIDIEFARRLRKLKIEGYSFREIAHYYGTNHVRVARNIKKLDLLESIPIPLPHVVDTYAYIFLLKSREHLLKERIDIFLSKGVKRENIYIDIVERDFVDSEIYSERANKLNKDKPFRERDDCLYCVSMDVITRPSMCLLMNKLGEHDTLWIYDWSDVTNHFMYIEFLFKYFKRLDVKVNIVTGVTDKITVRMCALTHQDV